MRARGAAISIVMALLFTAGCGSSSKSSSSGSSSAASSSSTPASSVGVGSAGRVSGRDGGFSAMLPSGFTDATARANNSTVNIQLAATAPRENGFATNINVIRSQVPPGTDIDKLTAREIAVLRKQLRNARQFSPVSSTTVAGQPARALDYLAAPLRRVELHIRQVFAINNGYAYTITFTALPAAYSSQSSALSQFLSSWRWS